MSDQPTKPQSKWKSVREACAGMRDLSLTGHYVMKTVKWIVENWPF